MMKNRKSENALPELLAPAGSREALEAAIEGGADAVYLGLSSFGARAYARNFSAEEFREAVKLAHCYGVKLYVTMNTLIYDREREDWLRSAYSAAEAGADALICADLGAARLASRYLPGIHLHASTQATGHNVEAARFLADLGFTRMVIARELPKEDVARICAESPIEIEQFVHGALCVSVSGQCLMSSQIGGRSGNRGECAQPCRLPYGGRYPLSLKDLSLARHLPQVVESGVASLKIEGRMKAPEYVLGVTGIYRRLLDAGRGANDDEMRELGALFSRGGFTDGYYTGKIGHGMLGVRSDVDKEKTASVEAFGGLSRKIPVKMDARFKLGCEARLKIESGGLCAVALGEVCQPARTAPITEETVHRALVRLGATRYTADEVKIELDPGIMLPVSALNDLRRRAVAMLDEEKEKEEERVIPPIPDRPELSRGESGSAKEHKVAVFRRAGQIPNGAGDYFDRIFLPLFDYCEKADGIVLPPVVFPHETEKVKAAVEAAKVCGARCVMIENISQLELVKDSGLEIYGGPRLNVTNSESAELWREMGLSVISLSPEVKLPQARDIAGDTLLWVYGRTPLMITEKCVLSELSPCSGRACSGRGELVDRRGVSFPVLPLSPCPKDPAEKNHRTEIFNSVPTYMADREGELQKYGIRGKLFVFTVETVSEVTSVIEAYKNGEAPKYPVRRV